jgi:hypothetical protein
MRGFFSRFRAALLLAALPVSAWANCGACGLSIHTELFAARDAVRRVVKYLCANCAQLRTACYACGMPVKPAPATLAGEVLLCPLDRPSAVTDPGEAARLFEETKREVMRLLSAWPPLPDHNISFRLVEKAEFKRGQPGGHGGGDGEPEGLTVTERDGKGRLFHTVHLLKGLPRARFQAVAAHEYTHAWLNEGGNLERGLQGSTVEGFCELVAHKLMAQLNQPAEVERLTGNAYTQGQLQLLLRADDAYRFFRVVEWFRKGADDRLEEGRLDRVLALKAPSPAGVDPGPLPPVSAASPRPPDKLILRGITGSGARRVALINDRALGPRESGKVHLAGTNLVVRCLEIRAESVLVEVEGAGAPQELFLTAK